MTAYEKLLQVAENESKVFDAGRSVEAAVCRGQHCVQTVVGDGSRQIQFYLPFEPTFLTVYTNAPEIRMLANKIVRAEFDHTALGQIAGMVGLTRASDGSAGYSNQLTVPTTVKNTYSRDEAGLVTVKDIKISAMEGSFAEGIVYQVAAIRTELAPLKTRLEESVAKLPDSAVYAYYQADKVNEAFTQAEWSALIATKPNCTFNLV